VTIGSRTVPGSVLGENLHALTANENGAHAHANTLSDPGHAHNITSSISGTGTSKAVVEGQGATGSGVGGGGAFGPQATWSIASATTGITINNASSGSGAAHNTVPRSFLTSNWLAQ
jgi:hypothetical protein